MNALRSHILDEVVQLDIKSLIALENILIVLKKTAPTSETHLGSGARLARKILANLSHSLSQTIIEEREERL